MILHPMDAEVWREQTFPRLREIGVRLDLCPIEVLLGHGLEWRVITELRGDVPLRPGTAAAVTHVVDSLTRGGLA